MRIFVLVMSLLVTLCAAPAAAESPVRTHRGAIDGAEYLVKVPHDWNGTLVLYSHGYYLEKYPPPPGAIALSTAKETEGWLLDHGYALAASNYTGVTGLAFEPALRDQVKLLDWFDANVGKPRRTISSGMSMGGGIATLLGERNRHRIDGVLSQCADYDEQGALNVSLDLNYAVRTLLTDDDTLPLVKTATPDVTVATLHAAIEQALTTDAGLAKLALIASLGNLAGWISAHEQEPAALADRIRAQVMWLDLAWVQGFGTGARGDVERRAGGNPSWNTGIDYRHQLAISGKLDVVRAAYQEFGGNLDADLAELNAGPRIAPDRKAVAYMYRYAVVRGTTPAPVVTLHNTADGGAISDQAGWYGELADDRQVRQLWVNRGNHCAFSAAEEVTALKVLEERLDRGRWGDVRPGTVNARAAAFAPEYQNVMDIITGANLPMPPAFTAFAPDTFQRPSR